MEPMAKAQRNSLEQIEQGRKKLRELPDKKAGKTRAETVELLAVDIRKAVAQGYSLKEIRDVLAEAGISVSLARMQTLLDKEEEKGKPPVADAIQDVAEPAQKEAVTVPQPDGASLSRYEDEDFVL